jgi:hypothetical protein
MQIDHPNNMLVCNNQNQARKLLTKGYVCQLHPPQLPNVARKMKVFWSRQRQEYPVKYYTEIFEPIRGHMLNCNKTCYSYVSMYTCIIHVNVIHFRKVK